MVEEVWLASHEDDLEEQEQSRFRVQGSGFGLIVWWLKKSGLPATTMTMTKGQVLPHETGALLGLEYGAPKSKG